jgi:hypothetical protein
MHRTAQLLLLVGSSIAFAALIWMRPDVATAAGSAEIAPPAVGAVPAGIADSFYAEKASAVVEPLPAQF